MFELDRLVRNKENKLEWQYYYQNNDIDMIYRAIEIGNLENEFAKEKIEHYRILIDDRVFVFIPANDDYQLNCVREKYNTNEKCKPRYTSDEYKTDFYDLGKEKVKIKKKGRKK